MNFDEFKEQLLNPEDITDTMDDTDIQSNKGLTIVASIFPILFFLPYVAAKESDYAKHYANQVFIEFCLSIALSIISLIIALIPILGAILALVLRLVQLAVWLFLVINACSGKAKYIPFIGKLFAAFN